ncbi:MAG: penicillin-binding protein 2 [Thiobacillaceae bacterium]|nr:penicillin-binding protein 2 [Thiobacillaceae bacterium]
MKGLRYINPEEAFRQYRRRLEAAGYIALALLVLLAVRFFWLQVVQYERYHAMAEENRIALVPVAPPRGTIYDRNGVVLAQNETAFTLELIPDAVGDVDRVIGQLAQLVQITPADIKRFRRLRAEAKGFESVILRARLTEEEVARLAVNRYRFPGVQVRVRQFRQYPYGEVTAHVVGYIGRISAQDKAQLMADGRAANYRGSEHIGKAGVEGAYERWLHGRTGFEKVETDSAGRAVRVLARHPPVAGYNLQLHLDAGLQQLAAEVFGEHRGALVALDPTTGGVLALVSRPGFDPNVFIDGVDQSTWAELNHPMTRPLINRALRGVYPPGSTIKPFMALAGLELGLRTPDDSIMDPGYFSLPGSTHRYRDWKKDGHGVVDLKKSIAVSCDTYYYRLAHQMGIEAMHRFLAPFGFGRRSGIDLEGELAGLLPSPEWKRRRFNQPWWPGETVIAGIGQGYMLATPLQLAVATMALANDGVVYRPQLIRAWQDPVSGRLQQAAPQVIARIPLKPQHLAVVKQAMVEVTLPGGTAAAAGAGAAYAFAGKTGTAQVIGIKQGARYDEWRIAAHHRDHALFIAFAPAQAPRIAVAVMVENGGSGSATAAPIARKVIDYWLLGKRPDAAAAAVPAAAPEEEREDAHPVPAEGEPPGAGNHGH